jgi:four helix bundle protein
MKRMLARSFRDLIVWQKAHQFALAAYRFTRSFLKEEAYGLTLQFRRAARLL